MKTDRVLKIAEQLLKNPTAPFREGAVGQFIKGFCLKRNIEVSEDNAGNLVAVYGSQFKNTVFAFAAHMDHPGFIAAKDSTRGQLDALFYGGVEEKYFKGSKVVFFTSGGPVKGVVTAAQKKKDVPGRSVRIKLRGQIKKGDLGMWDLPAFRTRGDILYSRACDDLIGCVSILALLDELHRRRIHKKVMAIFTTAEEAGLEGAKHLCINKGIPKSANLIAIETSSLLPGVQMGGGVVIRVGDRSSIFTPAFTSFLAVCAKRLQSEDKTFNYQRKLMDAGSCESTVYNMFGFTNAAVCIPLGNYHNRKFRTGRIGAEYVSISDLKHMIKLFLSVVENCESLKSFLKPKSPRYKRVRGQLGEFFYKTNTK